MVTYGIPLINDNTTTDNTIDNTTDNTTSDSFLTSSEIKTVLGLAVGLCVIAGIMSLAMIKLAVKFAKTVITFALWFNVAISFALAVAAFLFGQIIIGAILALLALLSFWYVFIDVYDCILLYIRSYAQYAKKRIPFATANLVVVAAAVQEHQTMYCVALMVVVVQIVWVIVWALASLGLADKLNDGEKTANGETATLSTTSQGAYFGMLVSFYWGLQVVKNVAHVTFAGTVAQWWFSLENKGATASSLKRALTTSFGSICLGSLIVAILKAIREVKIFMRFWNCSNIYLIIMFIDSSAGSSRG